MGSCPVPCQSSWLELPAGHRMGRIWWRQVLMKPSIMDKSSWDVLRKDPFGSTSDFSVSNLDISTPSPLFNVLTRWKCPRSVLQHWKGGLAINKKDAFWNYGRTPIESVFFFLHMSTLLSMIVVLNAKCEIAVLTQCSRQWLFCDEQNIVHLVIYVYMLTSHEEISKTEKP